MSDLPITEMEDALFLEHDVHGIFSESISRLVELDVVEDLLHRFDAELATDGTDGC